MAVELKGLGGFIKKTLLNIVSIEDDSSENTQVLKITLAEKKRVRGSLPLDNGKPCMWEDSVMYIAQPNDELEGDITLFLKGIQNKKDDDDNFIPNEDGYIRYEGTMKEDVAKPKIRIVGGVEKVIKEPRLWLRSVSFAKGGQALSQDTRAKQGTAIANLFASLEEGPETPAPTINVPNRTVVTTDTE